MSIHGVGGTANNFYFVNRGIDGLSLQDATNPAPRSPYPPPSTSAKPPRQRPGPTPEIFVFDRFGGSHVASIDLNGDGVEDVEHGDVVSAIIEGQTGIAPIKVQTSEFNAARDVLEVLDRLLERNSLDGVYLNFSINAGGDHQVKEAILKAADRGAIVFIAAGNDDTNNLTHGLRHANIRIVSASGGVVGEPHNASKYPSQIENPYRTDVFNGRVSPRQVPGGIDITNDGNPDLKARESGGWNEIDGTHVTNLDRTREIARRGIDFVRNPLYGGIVSGRDFKRLSGLNYYDFWRDAAQDLSYRSGLSPRALEDLWFSGTEVINYLNGLTEESPLPYTTDPNGRLVRVPISSSLEFYPASSWATPNLLASEVNRLRTVKTKTDALPPNEGRTRVDPRR